MALEADLITAIKRHLKLWGPTTLVELVDAIADSRARKYKLAIFERELNYLCADGTVEILPPKTRRGAPLYRLIDIFN